MVFYSIYDYWNTVIIRKNAAHIGIQSLLILFTDFSSSSFDMEDRMNVYS